MRPHADDLSELEGKPASIEEFFAEVDAHISARDARVQMQVELRLDASAWKADRRRFTGEPLTGFGSL